MAHNTPGGGRIGDHDSAAPLRFEKGVLATIHFIAVRRIGPIAGVELLR